MLISATGVTLGGISQGIGNVILSDAKDEGASGSVKQTGTIWDSIKATQPAYEGTSIPKSFNIKVGNKEIWVHPNGTKHMFEYVTRDAQHIGTFTTSVSSQSMLSEFGSALNDAVIKNGIIYDKKIFGGGWEFILSAPREAGQNIVVKHASFISK